MNHFLKIDSRAAIELTNRLEKLGKSDFPAAVRGTLNRAAFDVKQKTMPVSADKHFEKRKENFFKANSRVEMARGWNVSTMRSTVGFIHTNAKYNNFAVLELEQQEFGGVIPNRTFLATDQARVGQSNSGMVKKSERVEAIKKQVIIDASKQRGSTRKQKYISAAIKAGRGGLVKAGLRKKMVYRINSIKKVGRGTVVNKTPVYSVEHGRKVRVGNTRFMMEAVNNTSRNMYKFYGQEAQRRFDKRFYK